MIIHSADRAVVDKMVGGLNLAARRSFTTTGNLASGQTQAQTIAAVEVILAKLHSADRTPLGAVKRSLEMIASWDTTFFGGDLPQKPTMLALATGGAYASGNL